MIRVTVLLTLLATQTLPLLSMAIEFAEAEAVLEEVMVL
jgi:hypothetical protein